jgi:hypothetical protein
MTDPDGVVIRLSRRGEFEGGFWQGNILSPVCRQSMSLARQNAPIVASMARAAGAAGVVDPHDRRVLRDRRRVVNRFP